MTNWIKYLKKHVPSRRFPSLLWRWAYFISDNTLIVISWRYWINMFINNAISNQLIDEEYWLWCNGLWTSVSQWDGTVKKWDYQHQEEEEDYLEESTESDDSDDTTKRRKCRKGAKCTRALKRQTRCTNQHGLFNWMCGVSIKYMYGTLLNQEN